MNKDWEIRITYIMQCKYYIIGEAQPDTKSKYFFFISFISVNDNYFCKKKKEKSYNITAWMF